VPRFPALPPVSLGTPGDPLTYYLNLRLKDPAAAPAFVA
jgi:hypothetical protein